MSNAETSDERLFRDLEAFAQLLEAEWYNGNLDETTYLRLNHDLVGLIAKWRQPELLPAP